MDTQRTTVVDLKMIIREVLEEVRPHQFLTPEDIAARLVMDAETIRKKCKDREIKHSKFGRLYRIKVKDFVKYCKEFEIVA